MKKTPAERDEQAVPAFTERFASVLIEAGFPPMPGRVFAALLVTDSASLTAADLASRLEVSPAAVSGAVRYLGQLGMISRERQPGSRRDVYRVINDVWYELSLSRDQVLGHWVTTAGEGVEVLGSQSPAGRRMADSLEYFAFLREELPALLARWRDYRTRRGQPGTGPGQGHAG